MFKKLILFLALVCLSGNALENSVVPLVEKVERIENIPAEKYCLAQQEEIALALERKQESLRLATYNMLFHMNDKGRPCEQRWNKRLPRIVELLEELQPDILGVQEVYPGQFVTLMPYLENEYVFFARPCPDEELNGIFYRKMRFELIKSHVWYISSTPDVPGAETVTMVQLKDRQTGKQFAVFNTHLSFSDVEKRALQASFIGEKVESVARKMAVFLMGDMNTFAQRQDLNQLPFYDGEYVERLLTRQMLKDARRLSLLGHLGPISTFTNAKEDAIPFTGTGTPGIFLDHIYVSNGITVLIHAVQPATAQGHFPSDHMPLFIDAIID